MIGCPKCGHQFEITEKENSQTNDLIQQFHQRQLTIPENINCQSAEDADSKVEHQGPVNYYQVGCLIDTDSNSWEREMIRERHRHNPYWPKFWC